jgi:crotonobetainyl-CoA:carnitine CoA-transferase CaiB-like acyl-CoA transferase
LAERNPRLVYASLSGFGQTGPYRDRAGHDLNYLALAGIIGLNAPRGGAPIPPAVQVADLGGASLAAVGILAALMARQRTGRGQCLDVSLYAASLAWLPTLFATYQAEGRAPEPGEPHLAGGLPQYGVYETNDGRYVTLGALEPRFLEAFLRAVGREDLADLRGEALRAELRAVFARRTLAEWVDAMKDVDTCFAPVNTLAEAVQDPQAQALGMFTSDGQLGSPFALSETRPSIRRRPPRLGEHTRDILRELNVDETEIDRLIRAGVLGVDGPTADG